ncbi:MAG TPA: 16S rRNA (adenine(1518)-N(6)/adenine(1519)-N(6))-dimethyltransferase RsmA [Frankiaceae bacterium]|nr:16S rRNA (adenine(1518)-N(6)/adenine(1519)-N(6))-dimethyltransferase RsmA [Frankiaceae bacterium]
MSLLSPADTRALARRLDVAPVKSRGQNFLVDPNTVRRIVRLADLGTDYHVLEIGPGLGSLTLGLLDAGVRVTAVELDPVLAAALPETVAARAPDAADQLTVITGDALRVDIPAVPDSATVLAANLPYNVAVPLLLRLLETLPELAHGVVMVQAEVAARLAAPPGSRVYGVPSAKLAWYAESRVAAPVPRTVFWPQPRVDSALLTFARREPPAGDRKQTFEVIDAAFAQRRKTLRAALAKWAGSAAAAEQALRGAGIEPGLRGEALDVTAFSRIAQSRSAQQRALD